MCSSDLTCTIDLLYGCYIIILTLLSKPLTGLQSTGPGLQYKVMWRQMHVHETWTSVTVANVSKFVVAGTPTFVPYAVKVQGVNNYGHGPNPAVIIGYSGEDC